MYLPSGACGFSLRSYLKVPERLGVGDSSAAGVDKNEHFHLANKVRDFPSFRVGSLGVLHRNLVTEFVGSCALISASAFETRHATRFATDGNASASSPVAYVRNV